MARKSNVSVSGVSGEAGLAAAAKLAGSVPVVSVKAVSVPADPGPGITAGEVTAGEITAEVSRPASGSAPPVSVKMSSMAFYDLPKAEKVWHKDGRVYIVTTAGADPHRVRWSGGGPTENCIADVVPVRCSFDADNTDNETGGVLADSATVFVLPGNEGVFFADDDEGEHFVSSAVAVKVEFNTVRKLAPVALPALPAAPAPTDLSVLSAKQLADRAVKAHKDVAKSLGVGLGYAKTSGDYLCALQNKVSGGGAGGGWLRYLDENVKIPRSTCSLYCLISKNWDKLTALAGSTETLSIREARRLLTVKPKPTGPAPETRLANAVKFVEGVKAAATAIKGDDARHKVALEGLRALAAAASHTHTLLPSPSAEPASPALRLSWKWYTSHHNSANQPHKHCHSSNNNSLPPECTCAGWCQ